MKNFKKIGIFVFTIAISIFIAQSCLAVESLVDTKNAHYSNGDYTLDDIRDYAIYLMQLILGIVGTLSLVAFIYGGVTFLISAGNSDEVKKGMGIIKAAIIGLFITFASVLIINVFFGGLGIKWNVKTGAITPTQQNIQPNNQ